VRVIQRGEFLYLQIWCSGPDSSPICEGRSVVQRIRALDDSISPHGLEESKHMKTNSFVFSTRSASSMVIMLERSCFHQICEFSIMWKQRSEWRQWPARMARRSLPSSSSLERSDARWSGTLCRQQHASMGSWMSLVWGICLSANRLSNFFICFLVDLGNSGSKWMQWERGRLEKWEISW